MKEKGAGIIADNYCLNKKIELFYSGLYYQPHALKIAAVFPILNAFFFSSSFIAISVEENKSRCHVEATQMAGKLTADGADAN